MDLSFVLCPYVVGACVARLFLSLISCCQGAAIFKAQVHHRNGVSGEGANLIQIAQPASVRVERTKHAQDLSPQRVREPGMSCRFCCVTNIKIGKDFVEIPTK